LKNLSSKSHFRIQPDSVIGKNSVEIDELWVCDLSLGIEIEEEAVHPESALGQQCKEFWVLDPADRLPRMMGLGRISS
jgi:hypothetical protein